MNFFSIKNAVKELFEDLLQLKKTLQLKPRHLLRYLECKTQSSLIISYYTESYFYETELYIPKVIYEKYF